MKIVLLCVTVSLSADTVSDLERATYVNEWIHRNIEYERSPQVIKGPFTTVKDGTGDCADLSALLLYTLDREGIPAHLVIMVLLDFTDDNGRLLTHAVVLLHGIIFDPANGDSWPEAKYPLRNRRSYEVDYAAVLFGDEDARR